MNYVEEVIRRNIMKLIAEGKYDDADKTTREHIKRVYENVIKKLEKHELLKLLHKISYVFKYVYDKGILNFNKARTIGSIISWIEVVKDGYRILELGTNLGITCSTIIKSFNIEEYITMDNSSLMLAIALFNNPISECKTALWNYKVKVLFGNPHQMIISMRRETFDHIVCKVPAHTLKRQYIKRLVRLLKYRGTLSIFIERDSYLTNKIHFLLSLMSMQVHVVKIPYTPAITLHAVKISL